MGALSWRSCQSPVAHSCSFLNHLNGFRGGMLTLKAKLDADLLLNSLSHFECHATRYTCWLNGVYHPHWLIQWSHHCSCMRIPVHCPWLLGYIDVAQTLLVLFNNGLTFLNRPHIHRSHFTLTLKFKKCWILATIELQFHPSFFVLSLSYKFVHSLYVLSPKVPFVVIILCSCLLNKKKRRRYISIVIYLTM